MIRDPVVAKALYALSFGMGACVASFLNVVIWRVPRGESIVSPPSHCPKCGHRIRWWENVPILSWLLLGGRCRKCRKPISARYILVETLGAALFVAAFWRYGFLAPAMWIWLSLMVVGSFIDFDLKLLPDFVTVGGMVLGVALSLAGWAVPWRPVARACAFIPPLQSVCGLAFGFSLLWLVRWAGTKAFRREAMGMGDVFLMGAVGAMFGPVAVVVTLILSSVFGSIVGLSAMALSKTRLGAFAEIPYGPYICMGCLVWMFSGPELVKWYLGFLGVSGPGAAM
jgi:leader peptidase (prepilin peptidase)/N-methyltransferase